jgi:site-specific recombinase XerD
MRHHVLESGLQKAVKRASNAAGIDKKIGCHTLRHNADSRIMPTYHIKHGTLLVPAQLKSA